jgi:hypothetical protein
MRVLLILFFLVYVEPIFDPNGDGVRDGLMWNVPIIVYKDGRPIAQGVTKRDSKVGFDLVSGEYEFRSFLKIEPLVSKHMLVCTKKEEIRMQNQEVRMKCVFRLLQWLPTVKGG